MSANILTAGQAFKILLQIHRRLEPSDKTGVIGGKSMQKQACKLFRADHLFFSFIYQHTSFIQVQANIEKVLTSHI